MQNLQNQSHMYTDPKIKEQYTISGSITLNKTIDKTEKDKAKSVDGSIIFSTWDNGATTIAIEFKPIQIKE